MVVTIDLHTCLQFKKQISNKLIKKYILYQTTKNEVTTKLNKRKLIDKLIKGLTHRTFKHILERNNTFLAARKDSGEADLKKYRKNYKYNI